MDSCDVLIVGGGPAGSSCAWGLKASGLRVVVLDKARFPRNKVCGGWITPEVLQALQIDSADYARGRTFQPITGFRISCMRQREVEVPYRQAVSYGIRRCEFDEYLLRRSGAQLCEGEAIKSLERATNGWIVNGAIKARLLVGAGGHFCPVARAAGNHNSDRGPRPAPVSRLAGRLEEPVIAQEVEFEMDPQQAAACPIQAELPELYFCHDLQGYGWCFRKGNFLNIGLGRLDQHALPEHVSSFVQFLHAAGKLGFDPPKRMAGHAYLLFGHSQRKAVDDALMLIGDSAGLAYVQSGEGIRPAVESGLMAAQVIQSAGGNYQRARLQEYAALLENAYNNGRNQALSAWIPRKLRNSIGRLLLTTNWFCRRMVVENWFLHNRVIGSLGRRVISKSTRA
jgi:menaquinone-9 beta-reductase